MLISKLFNAIGGQPLVIDQGSAEHKAYRRLGWIILGVILLLAPFLLDAFGWTFQITRLSRAIALAIAILGLNLVVGYSGLLALCQSAFIGVGAFVTASLVMDSGFPHLLTLPFAVFLSFLAGVALGIPALKIKGLYLAMATVAFAGMFPSLTKLEIGFLHFADWTGGADGRKVDDLNAPGWVPYLDDTNQEIFRYFIVLIFAMIAFWLVSNLIKSRVGRAIISIRDNEIGAAVSGVNLRWFKVLNFGLSAAIGGLAGGLWAINASFAAEQDFTFVLMVDLLVGLVVGGVATVSGAAVGAFVVVFGRWVCQTYIDVSLFAVIVFGLIIYGAIFLAKKQEGVRTRILTFLGVAIAGTVVQSLLWTAVDMPDLYQLDGGGPLSQAIFGLVLIVMVFTAPQGIIGTIRQLRTRWVQIRPIPPALPEGAQSISTSSSAVSDTVGTAGG